MSQPHLWILGSTARPEFQAVLDTLQADAEFQRFEAVEELIDQLTAGQPPPDAILIAQSFPGQFEEHSLRALRSLAPVSPLISLAGSWCEGELRTGQPIQAAWRIYWHQGAPRLNENLRRLFLNRLPLWGLPATVGEEERFLQQSVAPEPPRTTMIAVASACFRNGRLAGGGPAPSADIARSSGNPVCGWPGVWAGIFNGSDCGPAEIESLRPVLPKPRTTPPAGGTARFPPLGESRSPPAPREPRPSSPSR